MVVWVFTRIPKPIHNFFRHTQIACKFLLGTQNPIYFDKGYPPECINEQRCHDRKTVVAQIRLSRVFYRGRDRAFAY